MKSLPGPSVMKLDEEKFSDGYWHWLEVLSDINRKVNHVLLFV